MKNSNLKNENIKSCVKSLANNIRAENINYENYLNLYSGIENIENIDNVNNTVIYGRRGSGKTHLLKALNEKIIQNFQETRNFSVYIDLRRIIPLLSYDQENSEVDAILTFKYLLQDVAHTLATNSALLTETNEFDPIAKAINSNKIKQLQELLGRIYLQFDGKSFRKPASLQVHEEEVKSLGGSAQLSSSPELNASANHQAGRKVDFKTDGYISILDVSNEVDNLMLAANLQRLTILLDEWSEISTTTQLHLAELIKKSFSSLPVAVKIAAIPNRTNLGIKTESKFIGLEDGGDISSYPLDLRYVFEVNKNQTRDFFNDLLYRHLTGINAGAISRFLAEQKKGKEGLINAFFANVALNEILVASAGIPRDFMNLFINSYDRYLLASNSQSKKISVKTFAPLIQNGMKLTRRNRLTNIQLSDSY